MCSNVNATKPQASSLHHQLLNKKARLEWSKCCNVPIHTTKPQASSLHHQLLNKARQEWSKCRDIPIKISKPQAVGMAGGKVYVGGGDTTDKQVFRYDSSTNECNHVPPHW